MSRCGRGRQRLRCQVVGRAAQPAPRRHARAAARCQAKVREADTAGCPLWQHMRGILAPQEAVSRLHIAMRHTACMQVRQRVQQRRRVRRGLMFRQRASRRHSMRQRGAAAPLLQQQIDVGVVLEGAVEAHQAPGEAQPPKSVSWAAGRKRTRAAILARLPRWQRKHRVRLRSRPGAGKMQAGQAGTHRWRSGAWISTSCTSLRRALGDSSSVALLTTLSAKRCAVPACSTLHTAAKPPLPSQATRASSCVPSLTRAGQTTPAERPAARSGLREGPRGASAPQSSAARRSQDGVRSLPAGQQRGRGDRRRTRPAVETSGAHAQTREP